MAHSIRSQFLVAVVSACWLTAVRVSASEASCAATGSCTAVSPSIEEDAEPLPEMSLLQMAVNGQSTDSASAVHEKKALAKQEPPSPYASPPYPLIAPGQVDSGAPNVASFVPEAGTVCFQGPDANRGIYVCDFRATPLTAFTPHALWSPGQICADVGFPRLAVAHDACWPEMSIYVRGNDTNVTADLDAIRQQSIFQLTEWSSSHNLPYEFAASWVACAGAPSCSTTPTPAGAIMWWGATRTYTPEECTGIMNQVVPTIAAATPHIASITTAIGSICWEGPYEYLTDRVRRINSVPAVAEALFANVTVQNSTCEARGFATVRDHRDECMFETAKCMHTETEDADMGGWVFGGPGISLMDSLNDYDARHGLPAGHSAILFTCVVCQPGGAAWDRGMILTNAPLDANDDRFNDEYCASFTAEERPEQSDASSLKPYFMLAALCLAYFVVL